MSLPNATPVAVDQTGGNAVAVTEDTLKTITLTATDADDDNLTFTIVDAPTNGTLGTIATPDCTTTANTCTATVDYTPAPNENNPDDFTFKANDGQVDSNTATVEINITAVNDAPSFTTGGERDRERGLGRLQRRLGDLDQRRARRRVRPDRDASPSSNDNNALFSVQPAVSPTGTLTFTPAANAFGIGDGLGLPQRQRRHRQRRRRHQPDADVHDHRHRASTTPRASRRAPTRRVLEDAGAQTVTGWATAISAGPTRAAQTVTFAVTDDNNALFSARRDRLERHAHLHAGGRTPTARRPSPSPLTDDGGTANGGDDTSHDQTFTITVTARQRRARASPKGERPDPARGCGRAVGVAAGRRRSRTGAGRTSPAQTVSFNVTNDNNAAFLGRARGRRRPGR